MEKILINSIKCLNWEEFKKLFILDHDKLLLYKYQKYINEYFKVEGYDWYTMTIQLNNDICEQVETSETYNILQKIVRNLEQYENVTYFNLITQQEDTCKMQDIAIIVSFKDNDFGGYIEEAGQKLCNIINQRLISYKFDKKWIDKEYITNKLINLTYGFYLLDKITFYDEKLDDILTKTNKSIIEYLIPKIEITICNKFIYEKYYYPKYSENFSEDKVSFYSIEDCWENGEYMILYFKDNKLITHIF